MELVDDVECIHDGPRGVRSRGRVLCKVNGISKVEDGRSLDNDVDELIACVCDRVVSASEKSGYGGPDSKQWTDAVRLETVLNSWCQPLGDAA